MFVNFALIIENIFLVRWQPIGFVRYLGVQFEKIFIKIVEVNIVKIRIFVFVLLSQNFKLFTKTNKTP